MTRQDLELLSKAELIRELRKLEAAEGRFTATADKIDREGLIHDLHVYQVELEMQNRELREAQERIEEVNSRYTDLYDLAPVGYLTLGLQGEIQEINLVGAALLGAPRSALLGHLFSAVAPLKDKRSFGTHLRRCTESPIRVTSELRFRLGVFETRWVQIISDPIRDGSGATNAYRTIVIDISPAKQLEAKLRLLSEAGEQLAASLEYTETLETIAGLAVPALADLCMIDVLSKDGRVERPSVRFADPTKQKTLAESLMRFTPQPGWQSPQALVIGSGEPMLLSDVSAEVREQVAHDEHRPDILQGCHSLMIVPLAARGRVFGALTLATAESKRFYSRLDLRLTLDLARRIAMAMDNARLYSELQAAVRARDNLLAIVSHDLRSPLAAIQLTVQAALAGHAADDPAKRHSTFELLWRASEQMNQLIDDLLQAATIEAGTFTVEPAPEAVAALIEQALEGLEPLAARRPVRLQPEVPQGLPPVLADRRRVIQVLSNLIGNAIKFASTGGSIRVGAWTHASDVCFAVSDEGPGITPEQLPHLFDRYWKGPTQAREGTGLGLYISKGIVEAHGGRIWVDTQVDAGSTFYFTIPIA